MPNQRRTRRLLTIGYSVLGSAIVLGFAAVWISPAITRYVEAERFRAMLEAETAKGLHFPSSSFTPIRRTGFLSAETEWFHAKNGRKAMTALDAHGIAASFNPLGVFLSRWQIDDLHIDHAKIGIHVYEPKPEPAPGKPWYHLFLPDRVYLKRVWSDDVDVTWPMSGETGGIFKTHLVVTPRGRDFEYHANGGTLKSPAIPDLAVQQIHLLITKKSFTLHNLDLKSGDGTVHAMGDATISGAKHADFSFKWSDVPIGDWFPENWRDNVAGSAIGDLHWTGNDYKLAAATMTGELHVKHGRVSNLKLLDQIAAVTKREDLARLELDECRSKFRWRETECELSDIAIEQTGKFRIEGTISFGRRSLGGTLQVGLSPEYLAWLPNPEEVFNRRSGNYLWTTMRLSGTLESPKQDLSPRLIGALKDSPGALLGAALRALGTWLRER